MCVCVSLSLSLSLTHTHTHTHTYCTKRLSKILVGKEESLGEELHQALQRIESQVLAAMIYRLPPLHDSSLML